MIDTPSSLGNERKNPHRDYEEELAIKLQSIADTMDETCSGLKDCVHTCFGKEEISEAWKREVFDARVAYATKKEFDRREWLFSVLKCCSLDAKDGFCTASKTRKSICQSCFQQFHGVSRTTLYRCIARCKVGNVNPARMQHSQDRKGSNHHTVSNWLSMYAERSGDPMPHKREVHLSEYRWKDVWLACMRELREKIGNVSESAFNVIRKENHKHLKCRQYSSFAKCDECTELKKKIASSDTNMRKNWRDLLAEHNRWQMAERSKMAKQFTKANVKEGYVWSQPPFFPKTHSHAPQAPEYCYRITIDSMDQAKTKIPNPEQEPKATDGLKKLQVHLTGARVVYLCVLCMCR